LSCGAPAGTSVRAGSPRLEAPNWRTTCIMITRAGSAWSYPWRIMICSPPPFFYSARRSRPGRRDPRAAPTRSPSWSANSATGRLRSPPPEIRTFPRRTTGRLAPPGAAPAAPALIRSRAGTKPCCAGPPATCLTRRHRDRLPEQAPGRPRHPPASSGASGVASG